MGEIKDYPWVFSLVGGFTALIALLTPAGYKYTNEYYLFFWTWGLILYQNYGYPIHVIFNQNPNELSLSLICSIPLFVCAITIIILSISYRNKKKAGILSKSKWLIPSILLIIGIIAYVVGFEVLRLNLFGSIGFWLFYSLGFGVIGIFLGAILSIIGHGIAIKVTTAKSILRERYICFNCGAKVSPEYNNCPECGEKVIITDRATSVKSILREKNICSNCGAKLLAGYNNCPSCGEKVI